MLAAKRLRSNSSSVPTLIWFSTAAASLSLGSFITGFANGQRAFEATEPKAFGSVAPGRIATDYSAWELPEPQQQNKPQIWSDRSGKHQTEAEFVKLVDRIVTLRKADGETIDIPLTRLSKENQEEAKQLAFDQLLKRLVIQAHLKLRPAQEDIRTATADIAKLIEDIRARQKRQLETWLPADIKAFENAVTKLVVATYGAEALRANPNSPVIAVQIASPDDGPAVNTTNTYYDRWGQGISVPIISSDGHIKRETIGVAVRGNERQDIKEAKVRLKLLQRAAEKHVASHYKPIHAAENSSCRRLQQIVARAQKRLDAAAKEVAEAEQAGGDPGLLAARCEAEVNELLEEVVAQAQALSGSIQHPAASYSMPRQLPGPRRERGYLGIAIAGFRITKVYPDGPAAAAGVQVGDLVRGVNGDFKTPTPENFAPGDRLELRLVRNRQFVDVSIIAADMPKLTARAPQRVTKTSSANSGEVIELTLPGYSHTCKIYAPTTRNLALLWLGEPVETNFQKLMDHWKADCDRAGIVFMVPTPPRNRPWDRTDLQYLELLSESLPLEWQHLKFRFVVYGEDSGGPFAWLLGLADGNRFSAIASYRSAPTPLREDYEIDRPPPDIWVAVPPMSYTTSRIGERLGLLEKAGLSMTKIETTRLGRMTDAERDSLSQWIDTWIDSLDRI
jgi:hypothetical protein